MDRWTDGRTDRPTDRPIIDEKDPTRGLDIVDQGYLGPLKESSIDWPSKTRTKVRKKKYDLPKLTWIYKDTWNGKRDIWTRDILNEAVNEAAHQKSYTIDRRTDKPRWQLKKKMIIKKTDGWTDGLTDWEALKEHRKIRREYLTKAFDGKWNGKEKRYKLNIKG